MSAAKEELRASAKWLVIRSRHLHRTGHWCEWCGAQPSEGVRIEVHHQDEDPARFFDPTNLITLCKACHRAYHWNKWMRIPAANDPRYGFEAKTRPKNYAQLKFDF